MTGHFFWQGQPVPFRPGETLASALIRAGIVALGQTVTGQSRAVFCGIGQCQGCLVLVEGVPREACLTPCRDGLVVTPETGAYHG
jgi:aerobic-type carbon monoxide dehydrogenase small subunit (CoxS/CutS family)